MPAEEDTALDEKRVFAETRDETVAWVASPLGVTRVRIAGDRVGRFDLAHRCEARDLAGAGGQLALATAEDVLVGTAAGFEATGFGAAVAVGIADGAPLAAGPDGSVGALEGDEWIEVGRVAGEVQRMDGTLVASADGLHAVEVVEDAVRPIGLDDARDVAASASNPVAATATGLHIREDDRWTTVVEGDATVVAGDGTRAHAVVDWDLRARVADDTWAPCDVPVDEEVVDVAYGEGPVAVTGAGRLLVSRPERDGTAGPGAQDGWRHRALGVPDARAVTVV